MDAGIPSPGVLILGLPILLVLVLLGVLVFGKGAGRWIAGSLLTVLALGVVAIFCVRVALNQAPARVAVEVPAGTIAVAESDASESAPSLNAEAAGDVIALYSSSGVQDALQAAQRAQDEAAQAASRAAEDARRATSQASRTAEHGLAAAQRAREKAAQAAQHARDQAARAQSMAHEAARTHRAIAHGVRLKAGTVLLLVLILGFVLALARRRSARRVLALAVLGLLVGGFVFVRISYNRLLAHEASVARTERSSAHRTSASGSAAQTGSAWTPSAEHEFLADVYPSKTSAATGLVQFLLKQDSVRIMPAGARLAVLDLRPGADSESSWMTEVASALSKQLARRASEPEVRVIVAAASTQPAEVKDAARIEARIRTILQLPDSADLSRNGELDVRLTGASGTVARTAQFVNAPWSEQFEDWTHQHAGQGWGLGRSDQFCASREQARAEAMQQAALAVEPRISGELESRGRDFLDTLTRDPQWVIDEIKARMADGALPVREFTQKFERPYGAVWRSAVLVNTAEPALREIAESYVSYLHGQRGHWQNTFVAGAGLALIICIVYLGLNAATRGYYVWTVRGAVLLLALAGVLLVLMMA